MPWRPFIVTLNHTHDTSTAHTLYLYSNAYTVIFWLSYADHILMRANDALPQMTRTFPVFEKKPKIKIYFLWKSVQPSLKCWHLIYKWSSKVYFPEACKRQTAIKNWQTSCPLQTFVCNISRRLQFIIGEGHRVSWVSRSLDSRVTGSLGHKMWPSSMPSILLRCKWPFGPFAFNKLTDWLNWHQLSGLRRH